MTFYTLGCVDLSRYSRNCFNDHPASFPVSWYLQVAFQDFGVHGLQTDVQTSLTFNIFQSRHLATSVCALQTSFNKVGYANLIQWGRVNLTRTWTIWKNTLNSFGIPQYEVSLPRLQTNHFWGNLWFFCKDRMMVLHFLLVRFVRPTSEEVRGTWWCAGTMETKIVIFSI